MAPDQAASKTPLRAHGLAQRLALWAALSTAASLALFAVAAYLTVVAEERLEPEHESLEKVMREARSEVGNAMLVAGPLCLLLAVGGTYFFARRTLRPLDRVIRAAAVITPRDLEQRLPVPPGNDEVRDIVLAFNGLLERLERGFNSLDQFALNASHELRTPLAVVATELEVMLQNPRPVAEWESSAKTCLDEVQRLTRLVEALLELARTELAPEKLSRGVDLPALIEHVLAASRERARSRGVYLGTAPSDPISDLLVQGEPAALQSALAVVVDNAIQYTPRGGEISVWCSSEQPGSVSVHVDDSGPGVDPDDVARIFEPFMRGSVGRESSTGFGLGLSIALRFCEHNGATIRVDRSPLGGARFSLTFSTFRALAASAPDSRTASG